MHAVSTRLMHTSEPTLFLVSKQALAWPWAVICCGFSTTPLLVYAPIKLMLFAGGADCWVNSSGSFVRFDPEKLARAPFPRRLSNTGAESQSKL